jgi:hypothetical protein
LLGEVGVRHLTRGRACIESKVSDKSRHSGGTARFVRRRDKTGKQASVGDLQRLA